MEHILSITDGKINFAVLGEDVVSFIDESEAADIVASYLILSQSGRIRLHETCAAPEDHGRPDFDSTRFLELIGERVEAIHDATLH
jgi:hypothetical protein